MSEIDAQIGNVSDTSLWVAYYRAKETERTDSLFKDPFAKNLLKIKFFISVFLLLVFAGCASKPKKSEKGSSGGSYSLPSPENLKAACDKGNPLACFEVGQAHVEKESWKEALEVFVQNCVKKGHPFSCTQAGYIHSKLGHEEEALKFSGYGCLKMDSVGCYNVACYNCRKNDVRSTLAALKRAERLGFEIKDDTLKDPDLACIKNSAEYLDLLKLSKKRKHVRTTEFHVVPQFYSAAFIPPYGFEYKTDANTLTFEDSSGAFVRILRSPEKFSEVIKKYKAKTNDFLHETKEFEMNGYRGFADRRVTTSKPDAFKQVTYILGNEDYVIAAQGGYPSTFEKELAPRVLRTVSSLIFDEESAITEEKLFFTVDTKKFDFKFAGISVDNFIEFAYRNPDDSVPEYPLVQIFIAEYKDTKSMKADVLKGFCTDQSPSPPVDFPKKKTRLVGKNGFSCEGLLEGRSLKAKNWALDIPEKKQRILIRSLDNDKGSHQEQISQFINTFQFKNKK